MNALHPPEGKLVYAKHVLFVWEADAGASCYQLQVVEDSEDGSFDNPDVNLFDPTHAVIVKDGLDFSADYIWRTRAIIGRGDSLDWSNIHHFSVIDIPDSVRNAFRPEVHIPEAIASGVTLCDPYGIPCAIESDGEVVWYLSGPPGWWTQGQWDFQQLSNGNYLTICQRTLRIFDLYNDTLNFLGNRLDEIMHHAVFPKSDGNFLALVHSIRWVRNGQDSLCWLGDDIIEVSLDGRIHWRWSCFDHLSTQDYDSILFSNVPPDGLFDWTHCNACPLDENEEAIYLSVRNLSRIVKIDYPSGDIIWSIGRDTPSGDVDFGTNLDFHFQHAVSPQPDGTLLLFDNHWLPDAEWSRAIIIDIDFNRDEPAQIVWEFRHEFSSVMGNAYKLENGNVLINTGQSFSFYEVTPERDIVWEVHPDLQIYSYKVRRVKSLFPLVFTITGPPDSSEITSMNTYCLFKINNEGELAQTFHYQCYDSRDWLFPESGLIDVLPARSVTVAVLGYVPQVDLWDEVTFVATPVIAPEMAETLLVHILPGEPESVRMENDVIPRFTVEQNYPNPFNGSTSIELFVTGDGNMRARIFDIQGRMIRDFPSHLLRLGKQTIVWDGKDSIGKRKPAGTYFLSLSTDTQCRILPMSLLP